MKGNVVSGYEDYGIRLDEYVGEDEYAEGNVMEDNLEVSA